DLHARLAMPTGDAASCLGAGSAVRWPFGARVTDWAKPRSSSGKRLNTTPHLTHANCLGSQASLPASTTRTSVPPQAFECEHRIWSTSPMRSACPLYGSSAGAVGAVALAVSAGAGP